MYPSVRVANQALATALARSEGHRITVVCDWMDMDDSEYHAECACGWRSSHVRVGSSAARLGTKHLNGVAEKAEKAQSRSPFPAPTMEEIGAGL